MTITGNIPCKNCGYCLRGLQSNASCPECSAANADSIEDYERRRVPINEWALRRIRHGLLLIVVSQLSFIGASIIIIAVAVAIGLPNSPVRVGTGLILTLAAALAVRGAALCASRRSVGLCLGLVVVLGLRLVNEMSDPIAWREFTVTVLSSLTFACTVGSIFADMQPIASVIGQHALARRMGDAKLGYPLTICVGTVLYAWQYPSVELASGISFLLKGLVVVASLLGLYRLQRLLEYAYPTDEPAHSGGGMLSLHC